MKDIIAAQQIQRRSGFAASSSFGDPSEGRRPSTGASLLSSAMKFRGPPEASFIADQQLPKRKKNPLLEKIRNARKQGGFFFKLPLPQPRKPRKEKIRKEKPRRDKLYREQPRQGQPAFNDYSAPFETPAERRPLGTPFSIKRLFTRKNGIILLILLGIAAVSYILIGYLPDPQPPEETHARESLVRGSFLAAQTSGGDAIPLDVTESFAWQNYTVRSGDTVEGIARRYGLSLDAVIASNNLRNVRFLRAGERIRIPNMDGVPYTVKSGDSYAGIAASQEVPLEAILDANEIQSADIRAGMVLFIPGAKMDKTELRQALGSLFIWPISGKQSSGFGWRNDPFTKLRSFHAGLDLSVPSGTPVKASSDGKVSATGYNAVYGNFVIVSHGGDYQTMYAHLSRILVKAGASVSQGSYIAMSGNSGRSTGAHLHFAVYKNKRAINPLEVLNK